jgi:hypothetical protein
VIELGWGLLALICLTAMAAWFWQDSLAARERANAAAVDACERLALQFLDGTVAFARLSFTRVPGGRLGLRRTYIFDYTANSIERRQGFVVLLGRRVESVGFAPGDENRAAPTEAVRPVQQIQGPNVLDFEEWRSRRPRRPNPPEQKREDRSDGWH